ncbi:phosphate ABC transporter permease subunit PstC [Zhaonella formicivorans]|uniref:phosphate ABC transporter permease subunit PstC n=1 Tax=Zhaonella formicivorans TaxID=2528593 RepID=UPI0010EDB896|nr:phosphate ABC transporter permease subunit PstC [Zhaonella formicivorans]
MHYKAKEKAYEQILFLNAIIAVIVILLIGVFVFKEGFPVLQKVGFWQFITGREWLGTQGVFGVLPMIVGTVVVTVGSLILGVPTGLATALFLAEVAPPKVAKMIRPAIELLAGIPSVIYGLFGLTIVVPFIRKLAALYYRGNLNPDVQSGFSVLAASIILAIMILPTIINIAEDAIRAVPREYKEGSLALGATHWQTISRVIVPAARSGIVAGIVLGMGRAVGETMAVIMVAGNSAVIPATIFSKVRTLTGNIAIEMSYSQGLHTNALFATGIILFIFIMIINLMASFIVRRGVNAND